MVDERRRPSKTFIDLWTALTGDVDAAPARLGSPITVPETDQAIGATPIPTESLSEGLYRVSIYATITQAAGTSSTLQVSVTHTDGSTAKTQTGVPYTANNAATSMSWTFVVRCEGGSPVSYATSVTSAGTPSMRYSLSVVLEQVSA